MPLFCDFVVIKGLLNFDRMAWDLLFDNFRFLWDEYIPLNLILLTQILSTDIWNWF